MNKSKTAARRLILRSFVLGGSATAASKLLPDTWVTPAIKAVITPAHAQTSAEEQPAEVMPVGVFQTVPGSLMFAGVKNSNFNQSFFVEEQTESAAQSVLDMFIKPANAGVVGETVSCNDPDFANVFSSVQISIGIQENPGPVQICLSSSNLTISADSTINGAEIEDVFTGDVSLTNLAATETMITGTIAGNTGDLGNLVCSSDFSALLDEGGSFICSVSSI